MRILISLLLLIFAGCSYQGYYKIALEEVERPQDTQKRYGDYLISDFQDQGITTYTYEDDMIYISWFTTKKKFHFDLRNKTDHTLKVIWDDAAYIDENGKSQRVMHSGVRYVDKNKSQPPSVVAKKSEFDDVIIPANNVTYAGNYVGWHIFKLFPNEASSKSELNELTSEYLNKTVQILLPLKIQGNVNDYIFRFKVKDFVIQSQDSRKKS